MAKPSKERVRKWREQKAKQGGRSLSTWLEPETAAMMDYLIGHYGESAGPLIAKAIAALYDVTCNQEPPPAVEQPGSTGEACPVVEVAANSPSQEAPALHERAHEREAEPVAVPDESEGDPLLIEIREHVAAGKPLRELQRTLLVEWIRSMKAHNVSFREMADRLNGAQIPTLSGKGQWEPGMIPTILLLSSR